MSRTYPKPGPIGNAMDPHQLEPIARRLWVSIPEPPPKAPRKKPTRKKKDAKK